MGRNPSSSVVDVNAAGGNRVIVVGGGLAGVCAAHAVLQHGGSVLLLDKSAFLGGNSTKASSGIAGTPTQAQISSGVLDGVQLFTEDTNRSFHGVQAGQPAGPVSPLVTEMARLSGPSLQWLETHFGCDLSQLGFMGGHSKPRTHRGKDKFPGMAITMALVDALQAAQQANPNRARVVTKARVVRLLRQLPDGPVTGVVYEDRQKKQFMERGAVIIATGGYAADFARDPTSLIARFTPHLAQFATTNGEHATGDGIKIAEQVGAGLKDMDRVQVHPSGLVDAKDPQSHIKFLCAEATRGAGGIIVDKEGKRFTDELARRDQVSDAMLKHSANSPFWLVLNEKSAAEMAAHCKHYVGRGLMTKYDTGKDFCAKVNISPDTFQHTLEEYKQDAARNAASCATSKKKGGGLWAAIFGGSAAAAENNGAKKGGEDETSGTPDRFGKTLFRNAEAFSMSGTVHVAQITPVVHYTMGGLHVNEKSEVLDVATKQPIQGLYCAGEAAGGVHGKNRLGGNSLLDCVVYGRVAGTQAARYLLETYMGPGSNNRLNTIYTHLNLSELPPVAPPPQGPAAAVSTSEAPARPSAEKEAAASGGGGGGGALKTFTRAEVAKHNKASDCWCIIHGKVLNLTEFLPDHPGGKESILIYAGKDATKEFDLVHQADIIEKYTPEAVVGTVSD